ncbi:MAG: hypothetical protein V2A54_13870 [Bacteroidota bacterium]
MEMHIRLFKKTYVSIHEIGTIFQKVNITEYKIEDSNEAEFVVDFVCNQKQELLLSRMLALRSYSNASRQN